MLKQNKGITLVALVITIIILLILAGVSINMIFGNEGIFSKTQIAAQKYQNAQNDEHEMVNEISSSIENGYKSEEIQTGLISDSEYKINNTTLAFDKIVVIGENETIKTLKDAFDYLYENDYKTNGAIVLKRGKYDTQALHSGNSNNINAKYNGMNISIIADDPGNTLMTTGELMLAENNSSYYINLKFYRMVFVTPTYGHGFHLGGDVGEGNEYYNCVFVPPTGGWNGNVSTAKIKTQNCIFLGGKGPYYNNKLNGTAVNCASSSDAIDPANGTIVTCLTNASFDAYFRITSQGWENSGTGINPNGTQANIGIYGGDFAWKNPNPNNVTVSNGLDMYYDMKTLKSSNALKNLSGYVYDTSIDASKLENANGINYLNLTTVNECYISNSNLASNYVGNTSKTISFWFKTPNAAYGHILGIGADNSNGGVIFFIENGKLCTETCWGQNKSVSTQTVNDNEWHHAVRTFDSTSKEFVFYLDGEVVSKLTNVSLATSAGPFRIGRMDGYSSFIGQLTNVRLYNRALSSTEVTNLHEKEL